MHPLLPSVPIVALIVVMTVRLPRAGLPLPAHLALPGAALLALLLQASVGPGGGASVLAARAVEGVLTSLMPLAIVFGAVLLFRTLGASGAMRAITARLERSTPDPVMRVLLIAWSFSYLVEGLSGFGTPAALAAPLLVGMGFPAVRAAAACLVMNTVPVVFGAVGTPIWFGLGELALTDDRLREVGLSAAVLQGAIAPVVVAMGLRMLFPWSALRARAARIAMVVLATVAASAAVAAVSNEFPSIVGGLVGTGAAAIAGRGRGRQGRVGEDREAAREPGMAFWRAAFPLAATVLLLAVTRIEPLGLRGLLNLESPAASLDLGPVGVVSVSVALVAGVEGILGTEISWSMAVLYVPFVIPFVVVSAVSAPLLGLSWRGWLGIVHGAARSLALPAVALAGALVFVKLMMHGGEGSPVVVLGGALADAAGAVYGPLWLGGAVVLGALGSFFSGSATVSNLTFAPVQAEIAEALGLSLPRVLGLQAIGAAVGNMVCVHNIVAVAAVLGLTRGGVRGGEDAGAGEADSGLRRGDDPVAAILRKNAAPLVLAAAAAAGAAATMSALS